MLSGIERAGARIEPGDEVLVEGEFFEDSIYQLSAVQVERVEPR